eukprot:m.57968 g.57968  ORF g.57968 m.57968 type:complete len:89 (-) comp17160_c0_seq2:23-289(-)
MNRKRPAGVTDREGKALKLDDDAATKDVQKHVLETVMFKRLMRMSNPKKVASRLTKIDFTDLAKSLSSVSEENEARTLIVGIVKRNSA